ncbi:MAG TPA: gluconokinase [Burkholderiaceae bacterium]|nr:gluconokinase [Burkholderiaceae bacterium]
MVIKVVSCHPARLVIMGVSGCGKSEIGRRLAVCLGYAYTEGDDYHPPENIAKMAAGKPLNDTDRHGWLQSLSARIGEAASRDEGLVLSCSALKRRYRDVLRADDPALFFIHLHGDRELLAARIQGRAGHFMPLSLLDSQLADLEPLAPDEAGIRLDISKPPAALIDEILLRLATYGSVHPGHG